MLQCQRCGAQVSTYDAEGAAGIAEDDPRTLCPGCAIVLRSAGRRRLIRRLWAASAPEQRCPHVRFDGRHCRCNAVGAERFPLCLFFPKSAD